MSSPNPTSNSTPSSTPSSTSTSTSTNSTTEYAYLCCPRNFFVGPRYLRHDHVTLSEPCPNCVRAIAAQVAVRATESRTLEGRKRGRRWARLLRWRWRDLWCSKLRFGELAPSFDLLGPAGEGIEKGIVNGAMKEAEQMLRRLRRAARIEEWRALFPKRREVERRRQTLLENIRRTTDEIVRRRINMAAELASLRERRLRRTQEYQNRLYVPLGGGSELFLNVSDQQIWGFPQGDEPVLPQALPAFSLPPTPEPVADVVAEEGYAAVYQNQTGQSIFPVEGEISPWNRGATWEEQLDNDSDVGIDLTDFDEQDRTEALLIREFERVVIAQAFPRPQRPDWRRDWRPRRVSRPQVDEDADEIEGEVQHVELPGTELMNSMMNFLIEEERRQVGEGQNQARPPQR